MWRFILITFGFLGWSFYELSGGSDYAPGDNSLQVRGLEDARPADVKVARLDDLGNAEQAVTRSVTSLSDLEINNGNRFQITLASVNNDEVERTKPRVMTSAAKVLEVPEETLLQNNDTAESKSENEFDGVIGEEVFSLEAYVQAKQIGEISQPRQRGDIRQVSGNVVNMRSGPGTSYDKLGKLTKGTEVAVLEEPGNGWVKLEVLATGETGWMADWLITASN